MYTGNSSTVCLPFGHFKIDNKQCMRKLLAIPVCFISEEDSILWISVSLNWVGLDNVKKQTNLKLKKKGRRKRNILLLSLNSLIKLLPLWRCRVQIFSILSSHDLSKEQFILDSKSKVCGPELREIFYTISLATQFFPE